MQTKLDLFFDWLAKEHLASPFVRLKTRTEPKLLASAQEVYPEGVQHLVEQAVQLGCSYQNCVRNATQILDFKAEQLWAGKGQHTKNNRYLVEHIDKPGQYYVAYRILPNNAAVEKWLDLASKETIIKPTAFLPKKSPPKHPIVWRTVKIENVEAIICGDFSVNLRSNEI